MDFCIKMINFIETFLLLFASKFKLMETNYDIVSETRLSNFSCLSNQIKKK